MSHGRRGRRDRSRPPASPRRRTPTSGCGAKAAATERFADRGGLVDCSIGTPVRPAATRGAGGDGHLGHRARLPDVAGVARRTAGGGRTGCAGASASAVDPDRAVAACVGTKEFVATTAQFLRLRTPDRDTVLYPSVSYPTYAMGATLAGVRAVPVPELPGRRPDLDAVDPADAGRALVLWVNSPANPTGRLTDLGRAAAWGRAPRRARSCPTSATPSSPGTGRRARSSSRGSDGVVAVHSLSKRSNLAGVRAGFYAGDAELVDLPARRPPARRTDGARARSRPARWSPSTTTPTSTAQRARVPRPAGLPGRRARPGRPARSRRRPGGFYLWVPVPDRFADGWELCDWLAREAGLLVSPGELYGPDGARARAGGGRAAPRPVGAGGRATRRRRLTPAVPGRLAGSTGPDRGGR